VTIEELIYEAYAARGVDLIIEITTDKKNRAASDIPSVLTKCGGNLTSPGALMFKFQRMGQFLISKDEISESKLMEIALDAEDEDIKSDDSRFEVLCPMFAYYILEQTTAGANIKCLSSEIV
jgi:transcriptional/translational regulatory protein YebC/TACO1